MDRSLGWDFAGPALNDMEVLDLERAVTVEEIKAALWGLKPWKAPGPDGLHAGFFRKCWQIVGGSLCYDITKAFENCEFPSQWNETLIVLVPKCDGPQSLNHFRPISLCNTMYKTLTKVIVNWIRPLLDKLVSPQQAAFIPGRKGSDNVIIAQELIHSMTKKKGRKGALAIKIDLEKAYDRIEWSFLHQALFFFKFPEKLIRLIMKCVATPSIQILVNGNKLPQFNSSRGLRQGDPLSPYLFVLCLEYLSLKIHHSCNNNVWKSLSCSRNGPKFSHLFFADDLLLFGEATTSNCLVMAEIVQEFCNFSGQKVSFAKSRAWFSPNLNEEQQ